MAFDGLWRRWDEARAAGRSPGELLFDISDDSLVELLAGGSDDREYEKDIMRTELRNRLTRRQRAVEAAADHALRAADRVVAVAKHTRDEAVETELLARGLAEDHKEGAAVADQAENTALAAASAEQTAEEAERVSGRVQALARAARPRVREG